MTHIKPVTRKKGGNRFCGPAVLSSLTGLDTDTTAALVRHLSGKRQVTGTSTAQVNKVLTACGFRLEQHKVLQKPTLARWLVDNVEHRTPGRVFLLVAGNHWQLVEGRRYVCGITVEIVSVRDDKVKRRARVTEVYEVVGTYRRPVELDQIAKRQAARKAELNAEAPLKKLVLAAQREGLVEWDYWDDRAYPPSIIYPSFDVEPDPYEGDHTVGSWQEAAALVETYRRLREDLKQAA
jgi:hypothetical protein